jgi:membrane fusion protein
MSDTESSIPSMDTKREPLFRPQVGAYLHARQHGNALLSHPPSHRFIVLFFAVIFAVVIVFFCTFSTTRTAQGQGLLVPESGVIRIVTAQPGIVVSQAVHEGQQVHAGDLLFELSNERRDIRLGSAERTVDTLLRDRHSSFEDELARLRQQYRQRHQDAERRRIDLEAELKDIDEQINLQEQRIQLSDAALQRYRQLQATGFISAAQMQDKQAEFLDQSQRLSELRRTRFLKNQEAKTNESLVNDLPTQEQREAAALERNISLTEQDMAENNAKRHVQVVAPQDGVLTAITSVAGQSVVAGTTLASIIDKDSRLEAEVYLPSRAVGFVRPGMEVLLRYQAYPYQKFGQFSARVTEVAATSMRPDDQAYAGVQVQLATGAEPVYRVRLRLDSQTISTRGTQTRLKSGMLLDASIVLERRRLYEWILDPMVGVLK